MTTDILSPRTLGPLLELYGFEYSAYLGLYLCCYELTRDHITGVDIDAMERALESDQLMEEFDISVIMCMGTPNGAEVLVIGSSHFVGEILIVKPETLGDGNVTGAAVFGKQSALQHFEDFMATETSRAGSSH